MRTPLCRTRTTHLTSSPMQARMPAGGHFCCWLWRVVWLRLRLKSPAMAVLAESAALWVAVGCTPHFYKLRCKHLQNATTCSIGGAPFTWAVRSLHWAWQARLPARSVAHLLPAFNGQSLAPMFDTPGGLSSSDSSSLGPAVSVDYLTRPIEVFKEMHRCLKPGGERLHHTHTHMHTVLEPRPLCWAVCRVAGALGGAVALAEHSQSAEEQQRPPLLPPPQNWSPSC